MPRAQDAQERRGTGRTGRKSFLSFSTLPPSLAVVAAGAGRHTGCISVARSRMLGATAQDAYMDVSGRKRREQVFERRVIGDYVQDVRYAAGAWMHRSGG
jgi:hypothetical protein